MKTHVFVERDTCLSDWITYRSGNKVVKDDWLCWKKKNSSTWIRNLPVLYCHAQFNLMVVKGTSEGPLIGLSTYIVLCQRLLFLHCNMASRGRQRMIGAAASFVFCEKWPSVWNRWACVTLVKAHSFVQLPSEVVMIQLFLQPLWLTVWLWKHRKWYRSWWFYSRWCWCWW